jgi:antitoxin (DNA-binding transcriptional repressor) of toxin-antitoxin stability system
MTTRITAEELGNSLLEILGRVRDGGEDFVIEKDGAPVAALGPPRTSAQPVTISDIASRVRAFQLNDPAFADDLEAIHSAQPETPVSPWPD